MVRRSSIFSNQRHHNPTAGHTPASTNLESTIMEEDVAAAEAVVLKWAVDGSNYSRITSLFHESRDEAARFLRAVTALQRAMLYFVGSRDKHGLEVISRAHRLMQTAIARLQKEFYQLLTANKHRLDPESLHRSSISTSTSCSSLGDLCSVDDEQVAETQQPLEDLALFPSSGSTPTSSDQQQQQQFISDLRSIAESMIAAGYSKECFKAYEVVRRSNVDETLFRLGFPRISPAQLHRLGANTESRLKSWPHAARSAVRSLFSAERILCEGVFGFSETIRESVFAEITGEGAAHLFGFPEMAAKSARKSPEKTFELLDAYDTLVELLPEIELIFSHKSMVGVTAQVVTSLNTVAEAVRSTLGEFESAVQSYNSKGPVPGGAIHPLTRYVMNYLGLLADYGPALDEIFANFPLSAQKPLPDYFFFPASSITPSSTPPASPPRSFGQDYDDLDQDGDYLGAAPGNVAPCIAWLVLVLLCRLDTKAGLYKENVPLAYLFLANNLNYVVSKVRASGLRRLLGAEWVAKHDEKARYYAHAYQKLAWAEVTGSIPSDPHALLAAGDVRGDDSLTAAAEIMRRFNSTFEAAYRQQAGWVVTDRRMRDELKRSIARKVMMPYGVFYGVVRPALVRAGLGEAVRFAPEDVGNYLSDLFYGDAAGSVGSSTSASRSDSGSDDSKGSSSWWRSR